MPQNNRNKSGSKTKIIIAVLIAGVVMITGLLYWYSGNDEYDEYTNETAPATQSVAVNMQAENIDAQKIATMAAVSGKTVSGSVTQRPDFVSEIEWQALQNGIRQKPDINLNNLINKLLFFKKKQAWLAAGKDTAERRQLARQLLDMIPGQLEIEAIDSETAKELETKFAADLR